MLLRCVLAAGCWAKIFLMVVFTSAYTCSFLNLWGGLNLGGGTSAPPPPYTTLTCATEPKPLRLM